MFRCRMRSFVQLCTAIASFSLGNAADIKLMRKNNLDFLDIATMNHFLNPDVRTDYNVAVLFYAQWDSNSHSFAGLWDNISRLIEAGTKDSRLIMGLFDCEASAAASKVCSKVGVTHYPSVYFLSTSGQKFTRKEDTSHITKYPGNWQYGTAVLDWINALRGLEKWHRSGLGARLRNLFFRSNKKPKEMLPLGIPGSISGEGESDQPSQASFDRVKEEVATAKDSIETLTTLVQRSTAMLDAILFPVAAVNSTDHLVQDESSGKKYTDMFSFLHTKWLSPDFEDKIVKTCVSEISIDFCQRLATHLTEVWMNSFDNVEDIEMADIDTFSDSLPSKIHDKEPYCAIIEDCIKTDFANDTCRPKSCPFTDPSACRYTSACLSETVYKEYEIALSSGKEEDSIPTVTEPESEATSSKKGWGL